MGLFQTQVEQIVERLTAANKRPDVTHMHLSQDAKRMLERAVDEARRMGHHYIGTEHLLLGLLRLAQGVPAAVFKELRISPDEIRRQTLRLLQEHPLPSPVSSIQKSAVGTVAWADLTVEDAGTLKDFYSEVVGWKASPVDMGEYSDFNMLPPGSEEPAAGICYARGMNADLPAQWLMYIVVADLDRSVARCLELGGKVVAGPRGEGARFCVIQDPAGAVVALYSPGK
jgi:predicted enzyme related to lactoylglutathione lyase